jgi:hypothetical protein
MISKWIVYGKEPQPLFCKLYPFVDYVIVDNIDIYNADTKYIIHFVGDILWIYIDKYISNNLEKLNIYNAVHLYFISGERIENNYNKCNINAQIPIIFTKKLSDTDIILSQRVNSVLALSHTN